jgi:hypothetical protein
MIQLIDQALEDFLRATVPLPSMTIDISFATPDRTWGAGLSRPTVNCFLWDVSRDLERAGSGEESREVDGQVERRPMPPRVELRYVITTWATEERDEHQLLGDVMRGILGHPELPGSYVPDGLQPSMPIHLGLAGGDERRASEFWSALGGQLKPGLNLQVSIAVEAFPWAPAGPRTATVEVSVRDKTGDETADDPASGDRVGTAPGSGTITTLRGRRHGAVVAEVKPES